MAQTLTTSDLWDLTHAALCEHRWGDARTLLDDLGLREDNDDLLASARAYGLTGPYERVIQDRIDIVNSKAFGAGYVPGTYNGGRE
jgi:hypothetical protein